MSDGPSRAARPKASKQQRARVAAVLRALAGSSAGRDVPPDPDPAEWGAATAAARAWEATSVVVGVYAFDSYADARAVEDRLAGSQADAGRPGRRGVTGVNGPLLLWATADTADAAGQDLLTDLQSAFAGDE